MSKTTNHFASGFDSVFPKGDRSSDYLTKNITRKCVEQAKWLIQSKEDDISVLTQDGKAIAGADEKNEENTILICRKYGAVRGALHFDDVALDRIAERMDNLTNEITYLNNFIEQMKAAFKECTGDVFTASSKPQSSVSSKRAAELRNRFKAA
tara:strand:- start:1537 stop:1995 length:459 start_codon:yes stop_codon:yes gene_type:complete